MPSRHALVAFVTAVLCGCASAPETPISFVAQKPALARWPFRRTSPDRSQPAAARVAEKPAEKSADRSSPRSAEVFLQTLPDELRQRIERELADASPEERSKLLAYFATVEPSRIPQMLEARRPTAKLSESPAVVAAVAEGPPVVELAEAEGIDRVTLAAAEARSAESPSGPLPRPQRNPLVEIQGVEFDDVIPASNTIESPTDAPLETEPSEPASSAAAASPATVPANPGALARLREWTTIRRPEPVPAEPAAVPPARTTTEPSALSLEGLGRRLRVGGGRPEQSTIPGSAASMAGESPHVRETLDKLISLMEAETARLKPGTSFLEREAHVRRHAELRMLQLMAGQPVLAQQAIPDTDVETQEFWGALLWSMADYFDNETVADPAERAALALERLRLAESHLQTLARLEVRSLTFCDKIDGFGAYHPFDQNVFRAGQPVLLYAEIQNFKTEATDVGRYRTSLRSTVEILRDQEGSEVIERRHFEPTEDQSRSLRRDYFHSYKLDLPLHLTPGTYTLRLTLEDELSGKIGAESISFLVR
jgi:hypothetical protein